MAASAPARAAVRPPWSPTAVPVRRYGRAGAADPTGGSATFRRPRAGPLRRAAAADGRFEREARAAERATNPGASHDFGRVRVHPDPSAVGLVQRAPDEDTPPADGAPAVPTAAPAPAAGKEAEAERKDVAFLMDPLYAPAARLFAGGAEPIRVSTPEEMAAALKGRTSPVGRMFIVAHSLADGRLKFSGAPGDGWVTPEDLADALRGSLPPERAPTVLDFRGCSIGTSPQSMEKLRSATGAAAAVGSSCFVTILMAGPVHVGGENITDPRQLKSPGRRPVFDTYLAKLPDNFGDARACILDRGEDAYFAAGGRLVSIFVNPTFGKKQYDPSSTCFADLPEATVDPAAAAAGKVGAESHCRRVRIETGKAGSGGAGGAGGAGAPALTPFPWPRFEVIPP